MCVFTREKRRDRPGRQVDTVGCHASVQRNTQMTHFKHISPKDTHTHTHTHARARAHKQSKPIKEKTCVMLPPSGQFPYRLHLPEVNESFVTLSIFLQHCFQPASLHQRSTFTAELHAPAAHTHSAWVLGVATFIFLSCRKSRSSRDKVSES